jgi:hypothetical protein
MLREGETEIGKGRIDDSLEKSMDVKDMGGREKS